MKSCYLDASALVKLATLEAETVALREHLAGYTTRATSRLSSIEVARAVARLADSRQDIIEVVAAVLEGLVLIELDDEIANVAGSLPPAMLRTLDAIHLASALAIQAELDALITYDARLAEAARSAGMKVVAPA